MMEITHVPPYKNNIAQAIYLLLTKHWASHNAFFFFLENVGEGAIITPEKSILWIDFVNSVYTGG